LRHQTSHYVRNVVETIYYTEPSKGQ